MFSFRLRNNNSAMELQLNFNYTVERYVIVVKSQSNAPVHRLGFIGHIALEASK